MSCVTPQLSTWPKRLVKEVGGEIFVDGYLKKEDTDRTSYNTSTFLVDGTALVYTQGSRRYNQHPAAWITYKTNVIVQVLHLLRCEAACESFLEHLNYTAYIDVPQKHSQGNHLMSSIMHVPTEQKLCIEKRSEPKKNMTIRPE